jgi:galactosamine-6-phosphate isomerase
MCEAVAAATVELMNQYESPLLCPASGDTPAGLYKELAKKYSNKTSAWSYVGLDEWMGMNEKDKGSCREMLNTQLFQPLKVKEEKICFFDGRTQGPVQECERVENYIRLYKGIDVSILGLGLNGHVGMNEPGTSIDSRSHLTEIDPLTAQTGQKYFSSPQQLKQGITLGLGTLLESKHIILIISGAHKASIAKRIIEEDITTALPATILRYHKDLQIWLDRDAAEQLSGS